MVDQWVPAEGNVVDLGWGTAVIHETPNMLWVERTCKSCGVRVSGPAVREGDVIHAVPAPFEHGEGCLWVALGALPMWTEVR